MATYPLVVPISNADIESGSVGEWSNIIGSVQAVAGSVYWSGYHLRPTGGIAAFCAYRDVAVPTEALADVDAGELIAEFRSLYASEDSGPDNGTFALFFLDGSSNYIGGASLPYTQKSHWHPRIFRSFVPAGTRYFRLGLMGRRELGANLDAYYDDFDVTLWHTDQGVRYPVHVPLLNHHAEEEDASGWDNDVSTLITVTNGGGGFLLPVWGNYMFAASASASSSHCHQDVALPPAVLADLAAGRSITARGRFLQGNNWADSDKGYGGIEAFDGTPTSLDSVYNSLLDLNHPWVDRDTGGLLLPPTTETVRYHLYASRTSGGGELSSYWTGINLILEAPLQIVNAQDGWIVKGYDEDGSTLFSDTISGTTYDIDPSYFRDGVIWVAVFQSDGTTLVDVNEEWHHWNDMVWDMTASATTVNLLNGDASEGLSYWNFSEPGVVELDNGPPPKQGTHSFDLSNTVNNYGWMDQTVALLPSYYSAVDSGRFEARLIYWQWSSGLSPDYARAFVEYLDESDDVLFTHYPAWRYLGGVFDGWMPRGVHLFFPAGTRKIRVQAEWSWANGAFAEANLDLIGLHILQLTEPNLPEDAVDYGQFTPCGLPEPDTFTSCGAAPADGFTPCGAAPATSFEVCGTAPWTGWVECGGVANTAPFATSVSISGTLVPGQTLTGSYTYNDADGDPESGTTFQWYRDGSPIAGATGSTYMLTSTDAGKDITFGVTPAASNGVTPGVEAQSAASRINSYPVASAVSISGTAKEGSQLTGSYTYSDADSDPEGTSTYRWLRDGSPIAGATGITYTLVTADVGKFITFEVTPVASAGATPGTPVTSSAVGPIAANAAPVASNVTISGTPEVGQVLTGDYDYSDADSDPEGTSTYRWLRDGSPISGATSITYTLVAADTGAYIKFEVTPVASSGTSPGTPVQSSQVGPVEASGLPVTSGLLAHHDAQAITGKSEGDSISTWSDLSGNGHDLTAGNAPTYRDGANSRHINNNPAVDFNGTANYLDYVSDYFLNTAGAGEVFIVLKNDGDPNSQSKSGLWHFSASDFSSHHPWSDSKIYEAWGRASRVTVGNPTPSMTAMHVYEVISVSGEYTVNLNGSQEFTTATNTPSFLSSGGFGGRVGKSKDTYYYAGLVGEIIIYNRKLDSTERSQVLSYLNTRWA